jgi:alkylhydroperoxidase/carboxymuconolactone decarboxylase family protein YurZ
MEKCGATQEEIAKAMASAMAASGASAEEIASALKETFAKAMASDPGAAADIARAMACALAAAGASAEDIARTMQEALAASVGAGGAASPEDLLEIAQTVARAMAEAGASPADISAAMRSAIAAAGKCDDPELLAELTKAMAKAMADAGASGEEIAKAMQEAMQASGVSEEEIAENILKAMASSGASAEIIAKTMQAAMQQSGMSQEEIQRHVIEAMVEAGASAEEIAQAIVAQNLFSAIGSNPEDLAKQLLEDLRSGKDITLENIQRILKAGGIEPEMATKVLMFQKALAASGSDPEEIAKAILLQKAWLNGYGNTPENIAKVLEDIISSSDGKICEQNLINIILNKLMSDDMSVDDVMKALMFDKALDMSGASVAGIKELMERSVKNKSFDQHDLSKAIQELLCNSDAKAESIVKTAVLQKLFTCLNLSPDDVAKVFSIQKVMYDSGATPQDISMLMEMALGGSQVRLEEVVEKLRSDLQRRLGPSDILNMIELAEAFQGTKIPAELISKIMLMQKAIEGDISSPEQTSASLANKFKRPNAKPEALAADLLDLLKKNGLGPESLEKSVLLQRAVAAAGLSANDLELVLSLQNRMFQTGRSADDVALAFMGFIAKSGVDAKTIAQALLASLDQGRVKEEDLLASTVIYDAIIAGGCTNKMGKSGGVAGDSKQHSGAAIIMQEMNTLSSNNDIINILRKAIEADKIKPEQVLKVLLLLKMITASDSPPGDLAKVIRIQKALLHSGVPADILCKTINETVKPRKKTILDRMKQPLQDIINGTTVGFSMSGQEFSNGREYQMAMTSNAQADDAKLKEIFDNAMKVGGLSKEDIAKALLVQKTLAASGVTPEIMAQAVTFQKALAAAGISPDEIADIFNRAISQSMSEDAIANLISNIMMHKGCSKDDIEKIIALQRSLKAGVLALGTDKFGSGNSGEFLAGQIDAGLLGKALLMQKILSISGLSPEDLGKAFLLQNAMIEAGASAENVANCMHRTLLESGISLEHLITLMEIELKSAMAKGLSGKDVVRTLQFERILGASSTAKRILRKINPEVLRLMEATVQKHMPGSGPTTNSNLMEAMKGALGNILDVSTIQAMEVSAAMSAAGASKEEIEEMMQMILNRGGGISDDFIESIKEAMASGISPFEKLNALKAAMEEEMNSVTNALRNTFINRIPTPEEIAHACNTLAEKLAADAAARTDVKLALVDVLDEALQG